MEVRLRLLPKLAAFFSPPWKKMLRKKKLKQKFDNGRSNCDATKESEVIELNQAGKGFCTEIFFWSGHSTNSGGAIKLLYPFVGLDSLANYVAKKLL